MSRNLAHRPHPVKLVVAGALATLTMGLPALAPAHDSVEPGPASWRTWVLADPSQYRLPAPPGAGSKITKREVKELLRLQEGRSRRVRATIRRWTVGPAVVPWTEVAFQMIVDHRPRPPLSARALAIFHIGMYDAMVAAYDSRAAYDPGTRPAPGRLDRRIEPIGKVRGHSTYASPEAAIAGAAETLLTYLFPGQSPAYFKDLATKAVSSRLYAGLNYRSDVHRARRLGRRVAAEVIERADADNSTATGPAYPRPEGEGYWSETAPVYNPPTGGPVGKWEPWLMETGSSLQDAIPGPFAYGSPEFMAELREVMAVQRDLTDEQREQAFFWADGPATFTPAGHWFDIALDLIDDYGLGTPRAARALALLGAVQADAAIAFFDSKYRYWSIRPITAVWRLCDGDARLCGEAEAAGNPELAPHHGVWAPLIETPPFPSYPGGHSTFSGSGAAVLTYLFPDAGNTLNELAQQAADSRLYGGIHFRSDNEDGLALGRAVAQLAIELDQVWWGY